ncbi:MAG TPA: SpoIIE family protein phosphatase [Acidobacteriaceae bacterium]|nr:SpoIIE family protein phosphatase [Acidobacteriaceae bacterium]
MPLLLALPAVRAWAQTPVTEGAQAATGSAEVMAWRSGMMDLTQGWREQGGDNPAWAQPNFDDRQWQTVELDDMGAAQPGWRWFRLHLKLAEHHPHLRLLIAGGEGTYELYINGAKADGTKLLPFFEVKRPTEQVIPVRDQMTELVLALRTHTPRIYWYFHLPLFLTAALGTPEVIENERAAMESVRLLQYSAVPTTAINLLVILAGIAALALYRAQKGHAEYRWLGMYLLLLGLSNALGYYSEAGTVPVAWNNLLADPLIYAFTILQIEFTFSFAGERLGRWWRVYEFLLPTPLILFALEMMGTVAGDPYGLAEAAMILPAAVLLPVMLLIWYRRGNREAGWLILPSLLPVATQVLFDVGYVAINAGWSRLTFLDNPIPVGPVSLELSDLGDFLFVLAIVVVMFFRFTRVSREQARVAAELTAAREIQRRLVPETLPEISGYEIEAAYFPAEEVGGDFYQVIETDGATLVVVGDVSGKGLKAAMTGTLALGALRALAGEGLGPGALLTNLNRQLVEMGSEGFVTCLCARVTAEGEVTLANAGHLPPYRSGEEMEFEPGMPLGVSPEAGKYPEYCFRLKEGDRLTLLSDGVVEARDARGVLFGFERTRAISAERASAIAEAALRYGQADDITVLTLARVKRGPLAPRPVGLAVVER